MRKDLILLATAATFEAAILATPASAQYGGYDQGYAYGGRGHGWDRGYGDRGWDRDAAHRHHERWEARHRGYGYGYDHYRYRGYYGGGYGY